MSAGLASPLVAAVEVAWATIQERHADVPNVVVTIGDGIVAGGVKLGHFAADRWAVTEGERVHELFVGGEGLGRGARDVLGTLLHEAAHAAAAARGVKDTSRQGRYHNAQFKEIGESFGLTLDRDPVIGWSLTTLGDDTADTYADTIAALGLAIRAHRLGVDWSRVAGGAGDKSAAPADDEDGDDEGKKPRNGYSLTCGCEPARRIRVSASTYEAGAIACRVCGDDFTANE